MVRLLSAAAVLSVCLLLVAGTTGADKKATVTNGKITKTSITDGKGTIDLETKKKGEEAKTTTVKVDSSTVVLKAPAEKGAKAEKGTAADLAVGQAVTVTSGATATDPAAKIVIKGKKKA